MFTWKNDSETSRQRTKVESVRFPNSITPKTHLKVINIWNQILSNKLIFLKVSIVIHTGIIRMPFTAVLTCGNKKWEVPGSFEGIDSTNIKLEFEEISLLEGNRKFSRM